MNDDGSTLNKCHCSGIAAMIVPNDRHRKYRVLCGSVECTAATARYDSEQDATEAWNRMSTDGGGRRCVLVLTTIGRDGYPVHSAVSVHDTAKEATDIGRAAWEAAPKIEIVCGPTFNLNGRIKTGSYTFQQPAIIWAVKEIDA